MPTNRADLDVTSDNLANVVFFFRSWRWFAAHRMGTNFEQIKANSDSFWTWKANNDNRKKKNEEDQFPITKFLGTKQQKSTELVLGPGFGAGIGCGAGIGFGLVGGLGYGGWPWNHLRFAFGFGVGCGVGFGFGFGQGIGYSFDVESRKSRKSKQKLSDSSKRIVIQI